MTTANILTLTEAAERLRMSPEGLRVKLQRNEFPARKVGKRWLILLDDIVDFIRSGYATPAETSWGVTQQKRRSTWHSTKEEKSGGSTSVTKELEYKKLLGPLTR